MKFIVSWETTTRSEVVVEASSKKEASRLVEEGQFDTDTLEEEEEFQGITMVEEAE